MSKIMNYLGFEKLLAGIAAAESDLTDFKRVAYVTCEAAEVELPSAHTLESIFEDHNYFSKVGL